MMNTQKEYILSHNKSEVPWYYRRIKLRCPLMKSIQIKTFAIAIVSWMVFTGCTKKPDVRFEVPFQLNFEIPAGLNPFKKHFREIRAVPSNLEALKKQFNIPAGENLDIRPGSAILSSLLNNVDYDFLEEIEISIFQDDPEDDVIAFLSDRIPFNAGRNVIIIPFDTDVSDFLETGMVNFKISFRLRRTTPSFIETSINIRFSVE